MWVRCEFQICSCCGTWCSRRMMRSRARSKSWSIRSTSCGALSTGWEALLWVALAQAIMCHLLRAGIWCCTRASWPSWVQPRSWWLSLWSVRRRSRLRGKQTRPHGLPRYEETISQPAPKLTGWASQFSAKAPVEQFPSGAVWRPQFIDVHAWRSLHLACWPVWEQAIWCTALSQHALPWASTVHRFAAVRPVCLVPLEWTAKGSARPGQNTRLVWSRT